MIHELDLTSSGSKGDGWTVCYSYSSRKVNGSLLFSIVSFTSPCLVDTIIQCHAISEMPWYALLWYAMLCLVMTFPCYNMLSYVNAYFDSCEYHIILSYYYELCSYVRMGLALSFVCLDTMYLVVLQVHLKYPPRLSHGQCAQQNLLS